MESRLLTKEQVPMLSTHGIYKLASTEKLVNQITMPSKTAAEQELPQIRSSNFALGALPCHPYVLIATHETAEFTIIAPHLA